MRELIVSRLRVEAEGILGVELRCPENRDLPPFTPGAHVDMHLPGGLIRQYSLANDCAQRHRYCLGIGQAANSRGGSRYVHDRLREGDRLLVSEPRSLFGLHPEAPRHHFIAGGIGITPILSMIRWCANHGRDWQLHYAVRSRACAAYLHDLQGLDAACVSLHADDEHGGTPVDLAARLAQVMPGEHVYCCGPGPLMDAVAAVAARLGIAKDGVHFERFAAPSPASTTAADGSTNTDGDIPFTIALQRHGGRFTVPVGESILSVLEANGIDVPWSCREGLCRTCEVPLLAGTADHRDYVLSDAERAAQRSVLICVSRSGGGELLVDL